MKILIIFLIMAINLFSTDHSVASNWPEIPVDADESPQWIANSINRNGHNLRILNFISNKKTSEIINFYKKHWSLTPNGYKEDQHNSIEIISHTDGNFLYTVEVTPADRPHVVISQLDLKPTQHPASKLELFMPPGSVLLSDVQALDDGILSRVVSLANNDGPMKLGKFYITKMKRENWVYVPLKKEQSNKIPSFNQDQRMLRFKKSGQEINITLTSAKDIDWNTIITYVILEQ